MLSSVGLDFQEASLELRRLAWDLSWDELVDHLVMQHAPDVLIGAVRDYLDASDLHLYASKGSRGIRLCRSDHRPRAVVHATRARLAGGAVIPGDFTTDGPHWQLLRHALLVQYRRELGIATVLVEAVPRTSTSELVVVTEFPAAAPPAFRAAVLSASARLRTERTLDFDRPVVIDGRGHILRFEPISTQRGAVELPFEFTSNGRRPVRAWLRLRTPNDPIAVVCSAAIGPAELAIVWGNAVIAFADLTCEAKWSSRRVALSEAGATTPVGSRARGRGRRSVGTSDARRIERRRSAFSSAVLEPSMATVDVLASYVAGHRRRLPEGRNASDSARRVAATIGVDLRPQETWVRPHARGVPSDAELHFRWLDNSQMRVAA